MKKIVIDLDGWVSLEDGEQEIGLGDIGVDVTIDDRRHTNDTLMKHIWKTGHKHDGEKCLECKDIEVADNSAT